MQKRPIFTNIGLLWAKRDESGNVLKYTGRIVIACPIMLKAGDTVIVDQDPNKEKGTMRLTICKPVKEEESEQTQEKGSLAPIVEQAVADKEGQTDE